ncbi:hypothetical protein D3C75_1356520 [compost metagenome]
MVVLLLVCPPTPVARDMRKLSMASIRSFSKSDKGTSRISEASVKPSAISQFRKIS